MGYCTELEQLGEPVSPCTKLSFHTPSPPTLPWRSPLLILSPNLSLNKKQHTLLRIFVGQGWKKITFFLVQQAQRLGDLASMTVLDIQGGQLWR